MEEEKVGLMIEENKKQQKSPTDEFVDDDDCKDCCCCQCCPHACARCRKESKGRRFCGCCPLSLGVYTIAYISLFIAVELTLDAVFIYFNEYVDPIYPTVLLATLIPLWVGAIIYSCNFRSRRKANRDRLQIAILFIVLGIIGAACWTIFYFCRMYKYDTYYGGTGDASDRYNYTRTPKLVFIIIVVIFALTFLGLYTYFWFVVNDWAEVAPQ